MLTKQSYCGYFLPTYIVYNTFQLVTRTEHSNDINETFPSNREIYFWAVWSTWRFTWNLLAWKEITSWFKRFAIIERKPKVSSWSGGRDLAAADGWTRAYNCFSKLCCVKLKTEGKSEVYRQCKPVVHVIRLYLN